MFPMIGILLKTILVNTDQSGIIRLIENVHTPIKKLCYSSGKKNFILYCAIDFKRTYKKNFCFLIVKLKN